MTIDINRLEVHSSSKFYLFYLRCASRLSGIVIAFGHPLYPPWDGKMSISCLAEQNNKWQWLEIYWLKLIGLVQRSAATWRSCYIQSNEPSELS